jgi:ribose transport system ATP-binding protein
VLVPEDRANQAMFGDRSVNDNFDVSVLSRYWRGLGFRVGRMRRDAEALRARFRVRSASGSVPIYGLSGGNQQKVIIGRWLRREPVLLLLDEPTQGVDVGARADIWSAVREVAGAGGAALIVTSDLEELAQVVDRAIILHDGRLTAHVPYGELTAHRLNELIYLEKRANNG